VSGLCFVKARQGWGAKDKALRKSQSQSRLERELPNVLVAMGAVALVVALVSLFMFASGTPMPKQLEASMQQNRQQQLSVQVTEPGKVLL